MGNNTELGSFIQENLSVLRQRWLDGITSTYHQDSATFIKGKDDIIHNPMGHNIREMVDGVLGCLSRGCDEHTLDSAMYPVIRMRAVQDFSASDAVSFIVLLKDSVATVAREKGAGDVVQLEMAEVALGLMPRAFDIYSDCREKLSEIKVDELKRNLYMMLRKSDMVELKGSD